MKRKAAILLVEDDEALLEGISDLLELSDLKYELNIFTATDGAVGLQVLKTVLPDLIISDIMMPRMDGYAFLRHLRENPNWVHIPVIFLTALGTRQDILAGKRSGAELYITKPYNSDELIQLVGSQLDRAFQLRHERDTQLAELGREIIQLLHHEFRTPLTYVTAYYEMLADGLSTDEIDLVSEYLQGILTGAERLNRLVHGLIGVMELTTGQRAELFASHAYPITDLAGRLTDLAEDFQAIIKLQNIQFSWQIPEALPEIFGDPAAIDEILKHLMDNAVKFMSRETGIEAAIRLVVENEGDEISIAVLDNGVGFPPQESEKIFELFYQYGRQNMEQQGAGAGLTIARGLAEMHGGHIEVDSQPGIGSRFTLRLPVYGTAGGKKRGESSGAPLKRKATIMIVEDELYLLKGLEDLLELMEGNYALEVITTSDGEAALDLMADRDIDLIISDIMMPGIDGYEFLSRVRQSRRHVGVPFIFLTAKGARADVLKGLRSGVEEYITKPYDSRELLDLIRAQLDRHFQRQSGMTYNIELLRKGTLNALLTEFHDPLQYVTGFAEQLREEIGKVDSVEALGDYLRGIHHNSSRVAQMAEDFITLAELRIGETQRSYSKRAEHISPNTIVDLVREEFLHDNPSIHFVAHKDANIQPFDLMADRFTLTRALVRLLGSACELSDSEKLSHIEFGAKLLGPRIVFSTSINAPVGANIDLERVNVLLHRQERIVTELTAFDPRLIIVKGIVDIHGGTVEVAEEVGQSFRFDITLPRGTAQNN